MERKRKMSACDLSPELSSNQAVCSTLSPSSMGEKNGSATDFTVKMNKSKSGTNGINAVITNNNNNAKKIRLVHQNVQGLSGKEHELQLSVTADALDIVCLTETWFKKAELANFVLKDYVVASQFCRDSSIRGGCLIAINSKYSFKNRLDITKMSKEKLCEISCAELKSVILVCIYRPPSGCFKEFADILEGVLNGITRGNNKHVLVCGDFNVDLNSCSSSRDLLLDLFNSYSLTRCIYIPTRTTNTSSTCIDNVFTDLSVCFSKLLNLVKSDHNGQFIEMNTPMDIQNSQSYIYTKKRYPNSENTKRFIISLKQNLSTYGDKDPNILFENFFECLILSLNTHIPVKSSKQKTTKQFEDWATTGIRVSRKKLFKLYSYRPAHNDNLKLYIKKYSKIFKLVCQAAKSGFIHQKINK
jgi:exonuclease III